MDSDAKRPRRRHSNFARNVSARKVASSFGSEAKDEQSRSIRQLKRFKNVDMNSFVRREFSCFLPSLTMHHLSQRVMSAESMRESHLMKPFVKKHWAAVLCVDISGFTRLSSVLGAEKTKFHCSTYFKRILQVVAMYKGDVVKFLGDAVFVMWPISHESDTETRGRVCVVAAECTAAIMAVGNYDATDIRPDTQEDYSVKLRLHCGLTCGLVHYFTVGEPEHFESLIGGKCLEQLSKCLDLAEHGQVVLTRQFNSVLWATNREIRRFSDISKHVEQILNDDAFDSIFAEAYYYLKYSKSIAFKNFENDSSGQTKEEKSFVRRRSSTKGMMKNARSFIRNFFSDSPIEPELSGIDNAERVRRLVEGVSECEKDVNRQYFDFQDKRPLGMVLYNSTSPVASKGLEPSNTFMKSRKDIAKTMEIEFEYFARRRQAFANYKPEVHGAADGVEPPSLYYRILVRSNVHEIIRKMIDTDLRDLMGTMLVVSTVFVNFDALISHLAKGDLEYVQQAFSVFYKTATEEGGAVRQFVQDDKGCVGIVVFGVPGFAYSDNACRALRFALTVIENVRNAMNIDISAGVTSGSVYSGFIGARHRCEWTVMGPSVNLSARLMHKAPLGSVVIDSLTFAKSSKKCEDVVFTKVDDVVAKGYAKPVRVYAPKFIVDESKTRSIKEDDSVEEDLDDDAIRRQMTLTGKEKTTKIIHRTSSGGTRIAPMIALFQSVPEHLLDRYVSLTFFEQLILKIASVSCFLHQNMQSRPGFGLDVRKADSSNATFTLSVVISILSKLGKRSTPQEVDTVLTHLNQSPSLILVPPVPKSSVTSLKSKLFDDRTERSGIMSRASLDCVVECLKAHCLFRHLKWPQLASLAMDMRPMRFMTGEAVYRQGDLQNGGFFIVEEGHISILADGSHTSFVNPGEGFGDEAIVNDENVRLNSAIVVPASVVRRMQAFKDRSDTIQRSSSLGMVRAKSVLRESSNDGCLLWMIDRATYCKHVRRVFRFADDRLLRAVHAQIPIQQSKKMHSFIADFLEGRQQGMTAAICQHIVLSNKPLSIQISKIERAVSSFKRRDIQSIVFYEHLLSVALDFKSGDFQNEFLAQAVGHSSAATDNMIEAQNVSDGAKRPRRNMKKELLDGHLFRIPKIKKEFLNYCVSALADLKTRGVQKDADAKRVTDRIDSESDILAIDWATMKISNWLLSLGEIYEEEGMTALSFNLAQIALLFLDAPTIPIAISKNIFVGCFGSMWFRSKNSSKLSSKTTLQLMAIQEAYRGAQQSIKEKLLKRRQSMYVGKHEMSTVTEQAKRLVSWFEQSCENILSIRGAARTVSLRSLLSAVESANDSGGVALRRGRASGKNGELTFDAIVDWSNFDIFDAVGSMNPGTIFPQLFERLFDITGFNVIRTLNVSRLRLMEMLRKAELSYCNSILLKRNFNPYHNALHGADVMCSCASIITKLSRKNVPMEAFTPLIIFSTGIASLLHDYKHVGANNKYLENAKHPLALRYKSGSILERMHAAEALDLVTASRCLESLDRSNLSAFNFLVTKLILCTDFTRGMKSVELVETAFRDLFQSKKTGKKLFFRSSSATFDPSTVTRNDDDKKNLQRHNSSVASTSTASLSTVSSVLGLVIECADISHPAKPLKLHQRWSVMVSKEFFLQGDLELSKGMSVSPMCDIKTQQKDSLAWGRSQQGFINFLVRPKFKAISTICDSSSSCWMTCLRENHSFWGSKDSLTGFKRLSFEVESDSTYKRAIMVVSQARYATGKPSVSHGISNRQRAKTLMGGAFGGTGNLMKTP